MADSIEGQITEYTLSQLEAFGAFGLVLLVTLLLGAVIGWLFLRQLRQLEAINSDQRDEIKEKDAHIKQLNEDFRDSAQESTKAITKFNDAIPSLFKR